MVDFRALEGKNPCVFTARKRSLRRLCFYRCLSVHAGGMHGCSQGGMCGCSGGGMHGCFGGCAWLLPGGCVGDTTTCGDTMNERVVRILLECILVHNIF